MGRPKQNRERGGSGRKRVTRRAFLELSVAGALLAGAASAS